MFRNGISLFSTLILLSAGLYGAILPVPDGFQTIQGAINASQDGDTVLVSPGTYKECIDFDGHNVVLGSLYLITGDTSFVEKTVIDGQSANTVIQIAGGETEQAQVVGLTVTGGGGQTLGGGFFIRDSSPVLSYLMIRDNGSDSCKGGGVYVDRNSHLAIDNCALCDNTGGYGGGLYATGGCSVDISSSAINADTAIWSGGAVYCSAEKTKVNLTDVVISENVAQGGEGGGILVISSAAVYGRYVTIVRNEAILGSGGAARISSDNSYLELIESKVESNQAGLNGGAFHIESASITLLNSSVRENSAKMQGGVIYSQYRSKILLKKSLLTKNTSDDLGSVIYLSSRDSVVAENCTISDNFGGAGKSLFLNNGSVLLLHNSIMYRNSETGISAPRTGTPSIVSISYSELQGGVDGIEDNHNVDITWGEGNLDADPLFANPDGDDYRLTENSPCIDAGDPASSRDPDGTRADIGAFYFDHEPPLPYFRIEPKILDFGAVEVGDSADGIVQLRYAGDSTITVTAVGITDGQAFTLEGDQAPYVLEAGDGRDYTIRFVPSEPVEYQSIMYFTTDDPDFDSVAVQLIGSADPLGVRSPVLPASFGILSAYPNPFNASVTVSYGVDQTGWARVDIVDVTGRTVATPVNEVKSAGNYAFTWDGSSCSAGVFLIRLSDGTGRMSVKKVVMMK